MSDIVLFAVNIVVEQFQYPRYTLFVLGRHPKDYSEKIPLLHKRKD